MCCTWNPRVARGVRQVVKDCIGDSRAYELTSEGQQRFLHARNRVLRLGKGIRQVTEAIEEVLANDEVRDGVGKGIGQIVAIDEVRDVMRKGFRHVLGTDEVRGSVGEGTQEAPGAVEEFLGKDEVKN